DAGALGINALVLGAYGDLGPRTRVAGSTHDLDQLLGDLRHFDTEQLDDHLRTGAGQHQLRTAVLDTDFLEQRANAGTGTESLARIISSRGSTASALLPRSTITLSRVTFFTVPLMISPRRSR